jgi:hypothetical protein
MKQKLEIRKKRAPHGSAVLKKKIGEERECKTAPFQKIREIRLFITVFFAAIFLSAQRKSDASPFL